MVAQSKSVLHLSAVIGEDRKLVIDLPLDTPSGEVEIILAIAPVKEIPKTKGYNAERERLRAKLLEGRVRDLAKDFAEIPIPLTEKDSFRPVKLPPGARPSEEILREIRDEED